MLVEFVYNEVLPMPSENDHNYNIKILDASCGSGIFLVEGYKRIIERWKFSNKQQSKIKANDLQKLLLDNIYGIEISPEAIKISAFSLYLVFLNYINPKEILRKVQFNPLICWTDEKEVEQRKEKAFGKNLLQANTFIRESKEFKEKPIEQVNEFFSTKFDLVVGNPPWKRSNVDKNAMEWAKRERWTIKRDIVKGFLAYVSTIAPNATIALIASAKVLFNTSDTEEKFRRRFFTENKVSVVVNFALVRDVLFENAKKASVFIIYTTRNKQEVEPTESFIYCVPKTKKSIQKRRTIIIDASEIKFLPTLEVLKPNSKIFKIGMYGGMRDLKFINKLIKKFKLVDENFIEQGMGLIKDKSAKNKGNKQLEKNYFIDTSNICPYYTPRPKTEFKETQNFDLYRTDERNFYFSPLILFKEGTKFGELCCSYVDYNCAFLSEAQGIKFIKEDENFHKAVVACLNSSLATYYFIQTSSSIGVDINRVQRNEISPFLAMPYLLKKETIALLANKVNQIIELYGSGSFEDLIISKKILPIKKEIDNLLYLELEITDNEQILIQDTLNYSNVIKENYKNIGAEKSVVVNNEIKQYCQTYLDAVNKQYKNSNIRLNAEIYTNLNAKDNLICVKFCFDKDSAKGNIKESTIEISKFLTEVNKSVYQQYVSSIYYRRIIKYEIDKNTFYLIKPNQKRFWTQAQALNDADNLIVEILNQSND